MRPLSYLSVNRCALSLLVLAAFCSGLAPASSVEADGDFAEAPHTFSYTTPADQNRVRALLELTGVYTVGFTFYVSTNRLLPSWNVQYNWPVYREKLTGHGFEFDINGLNTNFVGHPAGGSMYYTMARSNRLSIAESAAFAIGGSTLWEMFGEVREFISINDMIVTPLAGVGIAEPMLQLGAFFDRSAPVTRNRVLGVLFAPVKSLNDLLDGRTLARAGPMDDHGFPSDEFHRFDLNLGSAAALQGPAPGRPGEYRTFEYRLGLGSYLVRLPGYAGAGRGSLWFSDGNVSSMQVNAAVTTASLVDLEVHTLVGVGGYYFRRADRGRDGKLRGQGTLLTLTMGYQYVLHDYDRDRVRPHDRFTSVQPLGLLLEQRIAWDTARFVMHVEGGLDFGGARPYALTAYLKQPDIPMLPTLIANNRYYFVRGAHLLAAMALDLPQFELTGKLRYESFSELDVPIAIDDSRLFMEGRASLALGSSPGRLSLVVQRRTRQGHMGGAAASRSELSVGLELGARY